jgi:hypothetical protein
MKRSDERELRAQFRSQYGLMSTDQLRSLGVGADTQRRRIESGQYLWASHGVVRLNGCPQSCEQKVLAACLAGGHACVVSHQSAAWIWRLAPWPDRAAITVPRGKRLSLPNVDIHRPADYPVRTVTWNGIPCTDPVRTLVDYASVVSRDQIDLAVDKGLGSGLFTTESIEAELGRLARRGRRGVGPLRTSLIERGLVGAPQPSVLESRVLRLLASAGIVPVGSEVRMGEGGRYRVDVLLTPLVVLEVDGYAYHWSPEQKTEDERRRRRLRFDGLTVLVYTWRDVVRDGRSLVAEVRAAIAAKTPR